MLKNNKQKINKKLDPKININKSYLPFSIKVDENGGEENIFFVFEINNIIQEYDCSISSLLLSLGLLVLYWILTMYIVHI
jgi:hypothetical protein